MVGDFSAFFFFFLVVLVPRELCQCAEGLTEGQVSARTLVCHWIWELEGILDSAIPTVVILEMEKTKCRKGPPALLGRWRRGDDAS